MSSGFIIICLAATLYASAFTDVIKHIISSFDAYTNEVRDITLMQCKKFSIYKQINSKAYMISCFQTDSDALSTKQYFLLPCSPNLVCVACLI
jgi:hypothetical protein